MQKFVLLCLCVSIATATLINFSSAFSETDGNLEICLPIGTLELNSPSSITPKMGTVKFPHSKHFDDVTCNKCHHTWKEDGIIEGCMTSGCHDSTSSIKKENSNEIYHETRYYKKAYHKQCIGCHKKINEKTKIEEFSLKVFKSKISPSGPTGCVECHSE